MGKKLIINFKYNSFKKNILIDGDKSISIRALLLGSQAYGKTIIKNILLSDDIINSIKCLKKLGIKILLNNKNCTIYGKGLNGFNYKKNIVLDAGNSGTFARLILGLLVKSPYYIRLIGDKSLSKRDFNRVISPLQKIGANFQINSKKTLPLKIIGSNLTNPILYNENRYNYNQKLFSKISNNQFNDDDFNNSVKNKNEYKKAQIKSIKDNNTFEINSVELIYSMPINSFMLVTDDKEKVYLLKILGIRNNDFESGDKEIFLKTKNEIKEEIYSSYDQFLNQIYKVEINYNTLERTENYFR